MTEEFYNVIGMMSGTSLDGVDLVYAKFKKEDYTTFKIIHATTISYSSEWKTILQEAIFYNAFQLQEINDRYGDLIGDMISQFIREFEISKIDFIASHGHTILHKPHEGVTLQIGNGQWIANKTGVTVICDFRTQDVQLGGQGAPLVPIGDALLFENYSHCVNLGGFANVSFDNEHKRIAYDICPVNIVLNHYTRKIGLDFDSSGKISSEGLLNNELFHLLNNLQYYKERPPKSLGLEWVQEKVFPLIDTKETLLKNILRTYVEHAALQIGTSVKNSPSVLYTGGGVFNTFLMNRIEFFANQRVALKEKELIEYKEALIFAFLGVLRFENKVNCLASVTGASRDHSSGKIFKKDYKE